MKILVIDSHKGVRNPSSNRKSLHWKLAELISTELGGDFIWSYRGVNDNIKEGYDKIVFVHASHYSYTDYKWISKSPEAELYYIINDYDLGEPRTLWTACKEGRKYTVMAGFSPEPSKIVTKYTKEWYQTELNSLCFIEPLKDERNFLFPPSGCVYWGNYRKKRLPYFLKYLNHKDVTLSTHKKNWGKFYRNGINVKNSRSRMDWTKQGLFDFKYSLYIEDTVSHKFYCTLACRFYESLIYGVVPLFDKSCLDTLEKSELKGYEDYLINSPKDIKRKEGLTNKREWIEFSRKRKNSTLKKIRKIILS